MQTKHLVRPLQIKAIADDGTFEGYGSVFDVIDSYRDVVMPGAFAKSIEQHQAKGSMPALLWQHKSDQPIGVWESMSEDAHGLKMTGRLVMETRQGAEAHALMKAGAIKGLSIGYSVDTDGMKFNEKADVYELSKINLWETSVVTFPANQEAQITDVRAALDSGNCPTLREFERVLRDAGFSKSEAEKLSAKGYKGLVPDDSDPIIEALQKNIKSISGQ